MLRFCIISIPFEEQARQHSNWKARSAAGKSELRHLCTCFNPQNALNQALRGCVIVDEANEPMEEGYVWNQPFCPGFPQEALIHYRQLLEVCAMPGDYFFGCPSSVLCRTHSRTGCQRNILREALPQNHGLSRLIAIASGPYRHSSSSDRQVTNIFRKIMIGPY
jgi:hypothetical protein